MKYPQILDIYYGYLQYTDIDTGKDRPVIIINIKLNEDTFTGLKITDAEHNHNYIKYYEIKNWKEAGLSKPSIICLDEKYYNIPVDNLRRFIGRLTKEDVENFLSQYFTLEEDFDFSNYSYRPLRQSKLYERFNRLIESIADDYVVVSFGKMNPPTIGHLESIQEMAKLAGSGRAKLYLSHTNKIDKKDLAKSTPLSYDRKLYWCQKAFSRYVDVVESDAKTHLEMLSELYNEGYRKVILVVGGDRAAQEKGMIYWAEYFQNNPDNSGKQLYDFDDLKFVNSGERQEGVSSTDVRRAVINNDYETFRKLVPFGKTDAKKLFNEIKDFYKDNNILKEELNEAVSSRVNAQIAKILYPIIDNAFKTNGIDLLPPKNTNYGREPNEILRLDPSNQSVSLDTFVKIIAQAFEKDFPKGQEIPLNNELYIFDSYDLDARIFGKSAGASGKYNSITITMQRIVNSEVVETIPFYIALKSSETNTIFDKQFTPSKVLANGIGEDLSAAVPYNQVKFQKLKNEDLRTINFSALYNQAVATATGNYEDKHYSASVENITKLGITKENVNAIMKDFGEVLSAGCLAKILSTSNKIGTVFFPSASNFGLLDFMVNGVIKVSQKAGTGAAASGRNLIEYIKSSGLDIDQVLQNYEPQIIQNVKAFIEYMDSNVYSVSTAKSFENMSGVVSGAEKVSWININELFPETPKLQAYFKPGSVNASNIKEFVFTVMRVLNTGTLKYEENRINSAVYCETIRNRYLARIFIETVNRTQNLIGPFNELVAASLGSFIQVYLVKPDEFLKGNLLFNIKSIESNTKYIFVDTSKIGADDKIGNKSLSVKLVS